MPDLVDIQHVYGDDVAVSASGDFAQAATESRTQLRVIRRLLTTSTVAGNSAYPWEPGYGAGLGAKIGEALDIRGIQAIVMSQMILEPSVAKVPIPQITVTPNITKDGAQINILYTTLVGVQQSFGFQLSNPPAPALIPPPPTPPATVNFLGDPQGGFVGDPTGGFVASP